MSATIKLTPDAVDRVVSALQNLLVNLEFPNCTGAQALLDAGHALGLETAGVGTTEHGTAVYRIGEPT